MYLIKYLFSFLLLISLLFPQAKIEQGYVIELPDVIRSQDFEISKFCTGATGFYFLDTKNRQIAFLSKSGEIKYSGGYGIDNDAFIDPIEIFTSKLQVWVVDQAENKLIEFDHQLNYLSSREFDELYPEYAGIDDLGNLYIFSDQDQFIYKTDPLIGEFENFIDISLFELSENCIADMYFANDGSIGILSHCSNYLYTFNRLGQLSEKFPLAILDTDLLIKIGQNWLKISKARQVHNILENQIFDIQCDKPILDISTNQKKLFILFSDKIQVLNVIEE